METGGEFEPLSYHCKIDLPQVPIRWLPMIHLYDPDTPFFPMTYFHVVSSEVYANNPIQPGKRAYGYVERIDVVDGKVAAIVHCNKDLAIDENATFLKLVSGEISERLGASNPVTREEMATAFDPPLEEYNRFLTALWDRTVPSSMGPALPFGRYYDYVFGLIRMVATFFSEGGRKGETIMTHYFMSKLGRRIGVSADSPPVGFYLFPTLAELRNTNDSLDQFPLFASLCASIPEFHNHFGGEVSLGRYHFSSYISNGILSGAKLQARFRELPSDFYHALIECFNAFDKGPRRTVTFLLMLRDMRFGALRLEDMTPPDFLSLYQGLGRTYQSPKVLNLYAQQGFGSVSPLPIDTWIQSFLDWPFDAYGRLNTNFVPSAGERALFEHCRILGKVERLLWFAVQARKVHSPICDDALWCLKWSSEMASAQGSIPRGANPLACCACVIRASCPAYHKISASRVSFNGGEPPSPYAIETNSNNNSDSNQHFTLCRGRGAYDDFTPVDSPSSFRPYPQPGHEGIPLTVQQFVELYGS